MRHLSVVEVAVFYVSPLTKFVSHILAFVYSQKFAGIIRKPG